MFTNPLKKMDMDRKKRSSNLFRQTVDVEKTINMRMRITISVVCAIFAIIVGRLVYLQLLHQDYYSKKMESYTAMKQSFSCARGTIYDSQGKVLVESVNSLVISYFPVDGISEEEEWKLADKLVSELGLKASSITERQLKDMTIKYKSDMEDDDSSSVLTKKQLSKIKEGTVDEDTIAQWKVDQTDVTDLKEHTKAVYEVKMKMDASPENQFKTIAEDVSEQQVSYLSENSASFPGFRITIDWKRSYSEAGKNMKSVLGSVSTQSQGIPEEEKEYYLALGYELNDRVGTSGLEKQYERYLSGTKSIYNISIDENGIAYLTQSQAGKNGYDLTLTINSEFQKKMDDLLIEKLKNYQSTSSYADNFYLVSVNPKTGGIISMSTATKDKETGIIFSNPTATYQDANLAGSVVKPATLYMGLNEGVVSPGEVINDSPMTIKGTKQFASYHNYGLINDITAIAKSSNVYMANIAIRLTGSQYTEGMSLNVSGNVFDKMRSYYNSFGLGVKTGIDLPNEAVGYIGDDSVAGKILYYAIGQYDSYTTMQLAQYVATVANNGQKVQLHLLDHVSEVNDSESLIYKYKTTVMSVIKGSTEYLKRSQLGMESCVDTNFCSNLSESQVGVNMAAKTGTAETGQVVNNEWIDMTNSSMIAYGPTENPEIAFACVAPYANNTSSNVCSEIIGAAAKEYFSNYRNK